MDSVVYFFVFVFGTVIGSFLNVVILRFHSGDSFLSGSSRCFSCGKKLSPRELIPVISFIIQKGRCRWCKSKISIQYPIVEFLTGLVFVLVWNYELLNSAYLWLLFSLLIIIAVYDFRHKIIPNAFVWLFNISALSGALFGIFLPAEALAKAGDFWPRILAGLAFASFFALLWLISRGRWIGLGDAKIALGLGWFLGPAKAVSAFFFSFWLGAFVSLILLLLWRRKFTMKSSIPFAPFLIVSSFLAFFLNLDILRFFYAIF